MDNPSFDADGALGNRGGGSFGELWVFGGEVPTLRGEVEIYNPVSNSWRTMRNMPTPRHGIWASVIGNKIYIPAGGIVQGLGPTNINEVFSVTNKRADFDGDGKTDLSVFRPSNGVWYLNRSAEGSLAFHWGISSDLPAPGDFDGDGRTDAAVFRATDDASQPDFYILKSSDFTFTFMSWGITADVPVVNDYDGDGKDDIAVFRPSTWTWFVIRSGNGSVQTFSRGFNGRPFTGDFDGDGKGDFILVAPAGFWFIAPSSLNYQETFVHWGNLGDQFVPADYDGDTKTDTAAFRPSTGTLHIRNSSNGAVTTIPFGISSDLLAPGDYDGDAKADVAIFRVGDWWINRSTLGVLAVQFGVGGDVSIPNRYLP